MKAEHHQADIAQIMGVHKSTVSREVRRNCGLKGYRPQQAHRLALHRRQAKGQPRISAEDWRWIERLLREDWSPEQISLWLAEEGFRVISHEWIYQHILEDKAQGGDLYRHLRCQKARKKRYGSYDRRGQLPNRVSIDARPAIVSLTERKSRLALMVKVPSKAAEDVTQTVLKLFYFAHPYASWERGLNENTNGLIRQYFPKGCDFTTLTQRDIQKVMDKLNNRPRKCLGMKTPNQVFFGINPPLH